MIFIRQKIGQLCKASVNLIDKLIVSTARKFAYKYIVTREETATDNYDAVLVCRRSRS